MLADAGEDRWAGGALGIPGLVNVFACQHFVTLGSPLQSLQLAHQNAPTPLPAIPYTRQPKEHSQPALHREHGAARVWGRKLGCLHPQPQRQAELPRPTADRSPAPS